MSEPLQDSDEIRVYGYMVVYRIKEGGRTIWRVDDDEDYAGLPAHYSYPEQAHDRVDYLRSKGMSARVAALVAEPKDTIVSITKGGTDA